MEGTEGLCTSSEMLNISQDKVYVVHRWPTESKSIANTVYDQAVCLEGELWVSGCVEEITIQLMESINTITKLITQCVPSKTTLKVTSLPPSPPQQPHSTLKVTSLPLLSSQQPHSMLKVTSPLLSNNPTLTEPEKVQPTYLWCCFLSSTLLILNANKCFVKLLVTVYT